MLPFGVTIPATQPQRSEISEGLTNYPLYAGDTLLTTYLHGLRCDCIRTSGRKTGCRHPNLWHRQPTDYVVNVTDHSYFTQSNILTASQQIAYFLFK